MRTSIEGSYVVHNALTCEKFNYDYLLCRRQSPLAPVIKKAPWLKIQFLIKESKSFYGSYIGSLCEVFMLQRQQFVSVFKSAKFRAETPNTAELLQSRVNKKCC